LATSGKIKVGKIKFFSRGASIRRVCTISAVGNAMLGDVYCDIAVIF